MCSLEDMQLTWLCPSSCHQRPFMWPDGPDPAQLRSALPSCLEMGVSPPGLGRRSRREGPCPEGLSSPCLQEVAHQTRLQCCVLVRLPIPNPRDDCLSRIFKRGNSPIQGGRSDFSGRFTEEEYKGPSRTHRRGENWWVYLPKKKETPTGPSVTLLFHMTLALE